MTSIIPIKDLKNATAVSQLCHESNEPVFITKNGYGDMVIMSMEAYEKLVFKKDVYAKIAAAEKNIRDGKIIDADLAVADIQAEYGL